jgi:3-oxoadipate enol-lactonase
MQAARRIPPPGRARESGRDRGGLPPRREHILPGTEHQRRWWFLPGWAVGGGSRMVRLRPVGAGAPLSRLVSLPGRGTTRVWECAGPPGADTLMLIHGATFTAELNWGRAFGPLARHFRVVAVDLRGHGDGIRPGGWFRLEDCADDLAALAAGLGIDRFAAVGYSMGGMIAQLLYRQHRSVVSGLVLCSTAGNVGGSLAAGLAALALPVMATLTWWNPVLHVTGADLIGTALIGPIEDPATGQWVRDQLGRTSLPAAISAIQAASAFSSLDWIGGVDVPAAVIVTARDHVVPAHRQRALAQAIPGAAVHELEADHGVCVKAPQLLTSAILQACWSLGLGRGQGPPPPAATAPAGFP